MGEQVRVEADDLKGRRMVKHTRPTEDGAAELLDRLGVLEAVEHFLGHLTRHSKEPSDHEIEGRGDHEKAANVWRHTSKG